MWNPYVKNKFSLFNFDRTAPLERIVIARGPLGVANTAFTRVMMTFANFDAFQSVLQALKSVYENQKMMPASSHFMKDLQNWNYLKTYFIRFHFNDDASQADVEKIFKLASQQSGGQLPFDEIKKGLEKIFPAKSYVEMKIILGLVAALAAAGAAYWGHQKISEYLASDEKDNRSWMTLYQPAPADAREAEEPSLFHSFGMGAE